MLVCAAFVACIIYMYIHAYVHNTSSMYVYIHVHTHVHVCVHSPLFARAVSSLRGPPLLSSQKKEKISTKEMRERNQR